MSDNYLDNVFQGTREEWAYRIVDVMRPELEQLGITMIGDRQLRIAVVPLAPSKLGLARASSISVDKRTNFIDLSTAQASPEELAHTLLHELLHAFDNCQSGHRFRWKRWAEAVGIERQGHYRGPIAERIIQLALERVGSPMEHVTSVHRNNNRGSQVRVVCPICRHHVHVPRKAVEAGFQVSCVKDDAVLIAC